MIPKKLAVYILQNFPPPPPAWPIWLVRGLSVTKTDGKKFFIRHLTNLTWSFADVTLWLQISHATSCSTVIGRLTICD